MYLRLILAALAALAVVVGSAAAQAPVISNVRVTLLAQTTATIAWDVSEVATGQVEYGETVAYGLFSILEPSFTYSSHSQTLSGLRLGTLYHYRVRSQNQAGLAATSPDFWFSTLAPSPRPPTGVSIR